MKHAALIALTLAAVSAAPALAACPPPTPGETAAEIAANSRRLVCLQQELSAKADQRRLQMQVDALSERLRSLDLDRRLDALPKPPVIVVQPPLFP